MIFVLLFPLLIGLFIEAGVAGMGGFHSYGLKDSNGKYLWGIVCFLLALIPLIVVLLSAVGVEELYFIAQLTFSVDTIIFPAMFYSTIDKNKVSPLRRLCIIAVIVIGAFSALKVLFASFGAYIYLSRTVWQLIDVVYLISKGVLFI